MERKSPVLDSDGRNFVVMTQDERQVLSRHARQQGSYDASRTTTEFSNYWANADQYDADSANSKTVRHTLISRSRYEIGNNGYTDGIAQTYATDLVGVGPRLRMQTGSTPFNQLIELTWERWAKAIGLRRKLWTMAHAKLSDGEAFAVVRRNPRVRHPVKIDLELIEAEQCQTPALPFQEKGYIDGVKFDEFGNPLWYEFLLDHPGSDTQLANLSDTEKVPAELVLHWYKCRRPGQHRGVPEMASTLNVGAASRRFREATVAAAETAADFTLMLKTPMDPDTFEGVTPLSTLDIEKRMMTALPDGYDAFQMRAEHPTSTYESFTKAQVNEQARPKSMPYIKAACDASNSNYASGRLDHQTYYGAMDVDRADCDDMALDPLFDAWLPEAAAAFGWFGGNPRAITDNGLSHAWDWPKHQVADLKSEASSNETKLKSGQIGLHKLYSDGGLDLEDEIPAMAQTFGVEEKEIRSRLLEVILPGKTEQVATELPTDPDPDAMARRFYSLNGSGATNGKH